MASAKQSSTRQSLRQQYRQLRKQISGTQRRIAEDRICSALVNFTPLQQAHVIAAYTAQDGEPDISPWCEKQTTQHKTIGLSKVGAKGVMEFHRYTPQTPMRANRYGILEPADTDKLKHTDIEAILAPLVAFDTAGHRLGMGGGYYDRFLARYARPPLIVGVAFACQFIDELPVEDWDIPMRAIITEQGVREIC